MLRTFMIICCSIGLFLYSPVAFSQEKTDTTEIPTSQVTAFNSPDELKTRVMDYFAFIMGQLKTAAEKQPDTLTFREAMKPVVLNVKGVFGGSYIDENWVIRQVLFPSHFLARGFDLKKVAELKYFQEKLKSSPQPQVSEPAHGSIVQPRLIAMRYPIFKDGRVTGLVSLMVRTEFFIKGVGLDKVKSYEIICLGKVAETHGKLVDGYKEATINLPSTEWVIRYND